MPKFPVPTSFEETPANMSAQAKAFRAEWHRQAVRASGLEPFYGDMIDGEVRFLGVIPPEVIARTGVKTEANILRMEAEQERGHVEKRRLENPEAADLILLHSVEALQSVVNVGPSTKPNHFELVCRLRIAEDQHLRMIIKFVPALKACSQMDEWWYASSHKISIQDAERR
jgi:hypothetical protein